MSIYRPSAGRVPNTVEIYMRVRVSIVPMRAIVAQKHEVLMLSSGCSQKVHVNEISSNQILQGAVITGLNKTRYWKLTNMVWKRSTKISPLGEGNPLITSGFPPKWTVKGSFDLTFVVSHNMLLSKYSSRCFHKLLPETSLCILRNVGQYYADLTS